MTYQLIRGDATSLPLADDSVDLIVTSPPYFALRSYTDGGEHYDGQIGSEATPQAFLEALWAVTAECRRVLKPSGSLFCNLGDKYSGGRGGYVVSGGGYDGTASKSGARSEAVPGFRPKTLLGLPWRYAIGCIDQLGLILRAEIVWSKPNCLSGGTVVYARTKGRERTIKVHDLCRHYQPEDVQLWNGQQWTQVVWWQPTDRAEGAQVEIEFRNGQRVGCTNEHRWPVLGKGNVAASDLAPGDVIESCGTPEGTKRPERVDDAEIGWFVGLYIAEGSRSGTTIQIASHADETARYKRLTALAESFGENCAAHVTSANGMTINLTGRFLDAILSTFVGGKDAYTKHLRPEAWTRSNRFLRAVLEGYLDGDGHDNGAGRWTVGFTGRNDDLAADLRALGARLGASVRLRRGTTTGFGQEWPAWTGTIYFDASRRKRPDAEVVAIRPSRARRFWDIGVEDDPHLFALASGVLTHNSLPESVTDRVRRSHEQWFHFTKEPRYFSAVDEIREEYSERVMDRQRYAGREGLPDSGWSEGAGRNDAGGMRGILGFGHRGASPLGKLPGSVWTVPTEPLRVPDHLGVDHFACVDTETEILTERGWLTHDQLGEGDVVAGYNLDTGMAEWTTCHAVHRYDHDGLLVAVEKRDLSMRLTPNHRCVIQRGAGSRDVVRADELVPAHRIPRSAEWVDYERKSIGEPLAALLGWVAAEGWVTAAGSVYLSQSLTENPEHVDAIDAVLARVDLPPVLTRRVKQRRSLNTTKRTQRTRTYEGREWRDVTWRLPLGLAQQVIGLLDDKLLTWDVLGLPENERRALLNAFIDGDGHRRSDGRIGIYQKHRQNLDVLQAIAVTLGYRTSLTEEAERFVLYLTSGHRWITLRSTGGEATPIPTEHYRGTVWCPTTGTGTFVARRRGRVFITGNSFPSEWPRRLIQGWSPSGVCLECGEGRRPVVAKELAVDHVQRRTRGLMDANNTATSGSHGVTDAGTVGSTVATITGYACACPTTDAPTRPAVILDPFCGTGTVPAVAHALGRHGIGIDLSADYLRLAEWRCNDPALRAKVLGVDKPKPPITGQTTLFDEVA